MRKVKDCYFIGQIASINRTFTKADVKKWGSLTGDHNLVYERGLTSMEINKPIVPGILSEGLISEVISNELPGCPCVMMQKELLFIHPVHIGNTITAEIEIININVPRRWITEKVRCMNESGIEVIKGQIVLKIL